MKDKVLISVVLCTYNGMRFIKESIDSVLNQTFTNFEFIIWNDGSTDDTEKIVLAYNDERIKYYRHENTGLGKALALACKEAEGKYIARIDDDDICMPNRLLEQFLYMESHPKCVLLSSSCYYMDESGKILGRSLNCTWNSVIKKTLKVGSATIHPASMFRTDAYNKTCGYLGLRSSQDRVLWSKMSATGKFHNLNHALIKYRLVTTSLSHVFENNPYSSILEEIRRKLIVDNVVLEEDIFLYNDVYRLCKRGYKKTRQYVFVPKLEEKAYNKLSVIFGDTLTSTILVLIKNVYCYLTK